MLSVQKDHEEVEKLRAEFNGIASPHKTHRVEIANLRAELAESKESNAHNALRLKVFPRIIQEYKDEIDRLRNQLKEFGCVSVDDFKEWFLETHRGSSTLEIQDKIVGTAQEVLDEIEDDDSELIKDAVEQSFYQRRNKMWGKKCFKSDVPADCDEALFYIHEFLLGWA